jgi:Cys-tRNA(Pro)/Cys-tRNA(Cys) deacylase
MNEKSHKLNSMRLLETNNIEYGVKTYDGETADDAVEVVRLIGVEPAEVFKTLVVERVGGGKPMLVMIPANRHLDLKKFAASIGQKKVVMASHTDAEKATGLKVGGIGALALVHKNWDVFVDRSGDELTHICVSAGQRGINLRVPVKPLLQVLKAKVVEAT